MSGGRCRGVAAFLLCCGIGLSGGGAHAEHATFATYNADQGLADINGSCLAQDAAGEMLVCSDHGVSAYDGRRFVNLDGARGLPDGGIVYGIAIGRSGRIAIQYTSQIYMSDRPTDATHPATSLRFSVVAHPGIDFFNMRQHHLVPWRGGFAFLAGDEAVGIDVPASGQARFESLGFDPAEHALLRHAVRIFNAHDDLWASLDDGRLCQAEPGSVSCYGPEEGLTGTIWFDVAAALDGRILARSDTAVATFDPVRRRWSMSALPDQGGQYEGYVASLGFFTSPDGRLFTQAAHGLDVLGPGGWHEMSIADGAPDGTIAFALTDASGQMWFSVLGRGLVRWVGYGHWTTLEPSDGLAPGFSWQTARTADGRLWVTGDGGLSVFRPGDGGLRAVRTYPISSYALAVPDGRIWVSNHYQGIMVIDPGTGAMTPIALPEVDIIAPGPDHAVWLGTEKGLYRVDDRPGLPLRPVFAGHVPSAVQSVAVAPGDGGVFFVLGGWLHHRRPDGTEATLAGAGWSSDIDPKALAIGHDGTLWVGSPNGLFHLGLSGDRIAWKRAVPVEDIGSTTVFAVMVDHRGWVWVGTSAGLSVFNGTRWMSVDANQGLLSNDVNEDGIREDPDGSVWFSTTRGLSHLDDPASLFRQPPLRVMMTGARLGADPVGAAPSRYTRKPLSIDVGTPNFGSERSVLFRHRLSGVDEDWVTSASGSITYPFVPPGRHLFTVVGIDPLGHRVSDPASLEVDVAFPWWRSWWAEALWAALAMAAFWFGLRVRDRTMYARQAELKRLVAQATEQLQHQATHDRLTGLLNRSEVEARLAGMLAQGAGELVVALLDVDHFKRINDERGHLAGDQVLRALGATVSQALHGGEYAGRYGGEELLLVVIDSDGRAAERILGLHMRIRQQAIRAGAGPVSITCSIGLTWAAGGDTWESLIGRADSALYRAKRGGRDRVVESDCRTDPVRSA